MPSPVGETSLVGDVLIVYSTFPSGDKAAEVARVLVDEHLAACVNIVPAIRSVYRWQAAVQEDSEALAIIKTSRDQFAALSRRLVQLHPYELPEVIAFSLTDGHSPYLAWVVGSVG